MKVCRTWGPGIRGWGTGAKNRAGGQGLNKSNSPDSKHSSSSLYYSNKRKTYGRYELKIKIKIYDLKIIYEWILVYNMFIWWYRSFTLN